MSLTELGVTKNALYVLGKNVLKSHSIQNVFCIALR